MIVNLKLLYRCSTADVSMHVLPRCHAQNMCSGGRGRSDAAAVAAGTQQRHRRRVCSRSCLPSELARDSVRCRVGLSATSAASRGERRGGQPGHGRLWNCSTGSPRSMPKAVQQQSLHGTSSDAHPSLLLILSQPTCSIRQSNVCDAFEHPRLNAPLPSVLNEVAAEEIDVAFGDARCRTDSEAVLGHCGLANVTARALMKAQAGANSCRVLLWPRHVQCLMV